VSSAEICTLTGANGPFEVGHFAGDAGAPTLLFAAGRGGSPDRHQNLLQGFHAAGFNVIAPHFDMLPDPVPTRAELLDRLDRLSTAVEQLASKHAPLFGIGHSIGASMLLVLAGATAYTIKREMITQKLPRDFAHFALLAPAIDFFRGPNALDALTTPLSVIGGTQDNIISPNALQLFAALCPPQLDVTVQMMNDAHHFSFMDQMPPHIEDENPEKRAEELRTLYASIQRIFLKNSV
jgi:alpha-beta hydrolase superfamily lysophospholipase